MNYNNKVVVITGASSGIGEASAIKFARKNAKVVLEPEERKNCFKYKKKFRNIRTLL